MTPGIEHYQNIRSIGRDADKNIFVRVKADCRNHYGDPEDEPPVPEGAIILAEFGHERGMYGRYSMPDSEKTTKCQISADDFHKIEIIE